LLSDGKAAREKCIVKDERVTRTVEASSFVPDSRFWGSWRGRIVRAIVLHGAYTRNTILKATKLSEGDFEQAHKELINLRLLEEKENGKFWVNKRVYGECMNFYKGQQEALVNWVQEWRKKERVGLITERGLSHFFLADKLLSKFSESLIEQATNSILVTNPYVKRCYVSDSLMAMCEKGITVNLMTRGLESEQFNRELSVKGVEIIYDESIHAKLIVVDQRVGVVSSMNFYAGSWGGASWEAGIATTERSVVRSITDSIIKKRDDVLCAQV
jgi:phosphatidylserine/phosphatidylglycerophosphate/cardiolipin synthase-like enzyme